MTDLALRVENLSKRTRIGMAEERPDTLVGASPACWRLVPCLPRDLYRLSPGTDRPGEQVSEYEVLRKRLLVAAECIIL